MREIKFKAWIKEIHEMVDVWQIDYGHELNYEGINSIDCAYGTFDEHKIKLLQFTGLIDRNGKEIYDGDICIVKDAPNYTETVEVKFVERWASFCLCLKSGTKYSFSAFMDVADNLSVEVIGNIYENHEVLK